jgi:hypothetical protein
MDVVRLADEADSLQSDSSEVVDHGSEDESNAEVEESCGVVVEIPPEPCPLCVLVPCDWVTFGEEICEECNAVAEQKVPNKEICFHAYRMYTHFRFGVLCQYDQRPLPVCVCREIMDAHPDPNHQYVGFQAAIRDVCVIVVSFINQ